MQAKKSLGQNFLLDVSVGRRIVAALDPQPTDVIVEIGPGTGFLTSLLAETGAKIVAIEKDRDLIPRLLHQFPLSSNVSVVEGDILEADITKVLGLNRHASHPSVAPPRRGDSSPRAGEQAASYKVVGNIPYYITAPIIRKLLALNPAPETIVLMVQKEVAERICAKPGDMSILAVATQYYSTPEYLFTVPRTAFDPVPAVDSAIMQLTPHTHFDHQQEKAFFRLVKIGFASRRKTLVNNLAAGLQKPKEVIMENLRQSNLKPSVRAQELTLNNWKTLLATF